MLMSSTIKPYVSLGCDPEVFLYNDEGEKVPSIGLFGGSKKNPLLIEGSVPGLGILEDNVTLEFNLSPNTSSQNFINNTYHSLETITDLARSKGLQVLIAASAHFSDASLASDAAMISGCDPDHDAYNYGAKRVPISLKELGNWRCAGGHLHFGYDTEKSSTPKWAIVQFLDACALMFWEPHFSKDEPNVIRKAHYGKPGVYRNKSYGLEYRSPSPLWLKFKNGDMDFIRSCHNIVGGILSDESRTRALYDIINWKEVYGVLSGAGARDKKIVELKRRLLPIREELTENGLAWIDQNYTVGESSVLDEDVAPGLQVPNRRGAQTFAAQLAEAAGQGIDAQRIHHALDTLQAQPRFRFAQLPDLHRVMREHNGPVEQGGDNA